MIVWYHDKSLKEMVRQMFVRSGDNTRIAYDVKGEGPGLLLLHGGFVQNRRVWHGLGYVERFRHDYTVITLDIRGHGESDASKDPDAYRIGNIISDIHAVADICETEKFFLFGFSFGGTIALQLAARTERVLAAIIAGSFFGDMIGQYARRNASSLEVAIKAQAEGTLDQLFQGDEERSFIESVDLEFALAVYKAMIRWPAIQPKDLRCPAFVYAGSVDAPIVVVLQQQREEIEQAAIEFKIFPGLSHFEEITHIDETLPDILAFLGKQSLGSGAYP